MIYIRSFLFNIFFIIWTLVLAIVASPFYLAPPKIAVKIGYIWSSGIMIALKYICGITYEISGKENLPDEPFVIASKHQSAWDTAIFLKELKAPVYILKKELLKIPLFGHYLKVMDMIPVDRSAGIKALKQLQKDTKDRLSRKHSVIIFPEGTRTTPCEKVSYKPGISFIYKDLSDNIPVIPVALNSGLYWQKSSFLKKPGIIKMQYLPPIMPGLSAKEFIAKLEDVIEGHCSGL